VDIDQGHGLEGRETLNTIAQPGGPVIDIAKNGKNMRPGNQLSTKILAGIVTQGFAAPHGVGGIGIQQIKNVLLVTRVKIISGE
jgi:hypothetical protein